MILLTHTDSQFAELVQVKVPKIARLQGIRDALEKYTSGYLDDVRLSEALKPTGMPTIELGTCDDAAGGQHSRGAITIDESYFKYYKQGHANYIWRVPVTVLHELGHWGYWKGQQSGHPSDEHGRAHNNHNGYKSPLTAEIERIIGGYLALSLPG